MLETLIVRDRRSISTFEYIHSQNIARFKRQMSETTDEALRSLLRKLIECEHDIQRSDKDPGQDS